MSAEAASRGMAAGVAAVGSAGVDSTRSHANKVTAPLGRQVSPDWRKGERVCNRQSPLVSCAHARRAAGCHRHESRAPRVGYQTAPSRRCAARLARIHRVAQCAAGCRDRRPRVSRNRATARRTSGSLALAHHRPQLEAPGLARAMAGRNDAARRVARAPLRPHRAPDRTSAGGVVVSAAAPALRGRTRVAARALAVAHELYPLLSSAPGTATAHGRVQSRRAAPPGTAARPGAAPPGAGTERSRRGARAAIARPPRARHGALHPTASGLALAVQDLDYPRLCSVTRGPRRRRLAPRRHRGARCPRTAAGGRRV